MTGRNDAPRDAVASAHMWVPVDATSGDFYDLGQRFGTQVGVLSEVHQETGHPFVAPLGAGFFDPRCLRWHHLQRSTPAGTDDNRLAVQVVNDYEAEYSDARPGDAPFSQPEYFTALNRTTREVDTKGRVALPSSHRRVIDSEDNRYALALTCRSVPLIPAESTAEGLEDGGAPGVPADVQFAERGTDDAGTHGGVTRLADSVSVGGVTFFGPAAVSAARRALAEGGSSADVARWASATARGLPLPPLMDADRTQSRGDQGPGSSQARTDDDDVPPGDPGWSVPLLNHPAGYVWSTADQIGLLGTLVVPEGAGGSYFVGREGTPIGPLPLRHDAQVSMGPELVGRIVFVQDDAAQLPEGNGKLVKGAMWRDSSRANKDTELGLETCQWRPVIPVTADLPPEKPPPWEPPPWVDPPPPEKKKPKKKERDEDEGERTPPGRAPIPPVGRGRGEGSGRERPDISIGASIPVQRRKPAGDDDDRELPPVERPGVQARNYEGPGQPCPNTTAGVLVRGRQDPRGPGAVRVPGGYVEYFGHPALTPIDGGVVVGGEQPRRRIPLGLPRPAGKGVTVDPAPDGVPHGRRVPTDDPGSVPLGLPGPRRRGGFGFEPPPFGDRGVPRGAEERWERHLRRERARRARRERDQREEETLDKLRELEDQAREAGRRRFADRVRRAREKLENRRRRREERRRRREEYQERKRREREERRRRREERRRRKREERERRRRERRGRAKDRKREPTRPQGGYAIDTTDPESEAASIGRLDEEGRRLLEEDRRRARERRRRYLDQFGPGFGEWNVANARLPFFGSPGGPASLEGWAHLATYQVRALQRVVTGAFGGPSYLAANLGVVHRNGPGNPPVGSRLGTHWTAPPGGKLSLTRGQAPLEVISVLEGPVCADAGGVLEVVREHRGADPIEDRRPLILLENARTWWPGAVRADLIADVQRRFYVDWAKRVTGSCLRAHHGQGDSGPAFEVARIDFGTGQVLERQVAVEQDGVLCMFRGAKLIGGSLELGIQGGPRYRVEALPSGELAIRPTDHESGGLVLTREGVVVEGHLHVQGRLSANEVDAA